MSTDDLTSPLRRVGSGGPSSKFRLPIKIIGILLIIALLVSAIGWLTKNRNPLGGEPRALVQIKSLSEKKADAQTPGTEMRQTTNDNAASTQIETAPQNSVSPQEAASIHKEIPPDRLIISGGKSANARPKQRPLSKAPIEGLFKRTAQGLLPQISANGTTPAQAYARPLSFDVSTANKDKPRIAILLTGLGISPTSTNEAIRKLPGAISLAFAPYGKNLQTTVTTARNIGHEVLLQLPMEPFDYPDNDPGPHTLLADTSIRENNIRTDWLLTRFAGYTGVTNYMGAKFTASPDAVKPFMKKIKSHGLFYFEDGASGRSQTGSIGKAFGAQYAKAHLIIDSEQDKKSVRQQLLRLENIARDKGTALGVASALPITIDSLNEWTKTLADKNIVLIPISATAFKKK